jgi:hypothetical protein
MMFRFGDCAGQGRCWISPLCSSNHDWTVPAVWMGALSSWKTASLFRGLGIAALPWMLDLWSSRRSVFVETGSSQILNIQFCCHLCCGSCVIFRNNLSQCTTTSFCQCLLSSTVPLRWCCLPMIRVCRHNLRNCRSRYTIHLLMW